MVYPRTSRAPTRHYPSASTAARGGFDPIFQLIAHEATAIPSIYNLADLLECESTDGWTATDAEDAVKTYVERSLPNVRVRTRAQLVLRPKVEKVPVSPTTIPDRVASTSAAATVPQPTTEFVYEVDSGKNWRATRDKLLVQLARMLASVRNYHPNDDAKVIGFYFPFRNKECVVQITLQWSDKDIRFVESRRYVKQHHVQSALREAYEQNHKLWEGKTLDLDAV